MMTFAVIRADSGAGELIVWLVVTAVWIIAQVISRSRKKDQPERRTPVAAPAQEPKDIDEFFDLLRQQFEAGAGKAATPPSQPPPTSVLQSKTASASSLPQTISKPRRRIVPKPPPIPSEPVAPPTRAPYSWETPSPAVPQSETPATPLITFETVRRDMLSLKVGFSSRGLRLPDVHMTSKFHRRAAPGIQELFHGRSGLKKAFIARVVLGTPRSVRPWLYPED